MDEVKGRSGEKARKGLKTTKHNLVYKITNAVNGKYYFGVHSTDNIGDGYMGSGTVLRLAVKAYGLNNFIREILFDFGTRDQALSKEKELVTTEHLENIMCYNLAEGGGTRSRYFSRKAPIYQTKLYEPLNKTYLYVFTVNQDNYNKWKADFEKEKPRLFKQKGAARTSAYCQTLIINKFHDFIRVLQEFYNNVYNHRFANSVISRFAANGVMKCVNIEVVKR